MSPVQNAADEPEYAGPSPLEQLMATGQALIDEARAALAERRVTAEKFAEAFRDNSATLDAHGPAYITVADWDAAIVAAMAHSTFAISTGARWSWSCVGCEETGSAFVSEQEMERQRFEHTIAKVLKAARVEVQRG